MRVSDKRLSIEEKARRLRERRKKKYKETHKIVEGVNHKLCNQCSQWYPANLDYFYKNENNGIDGLHPKCKKCTIKNSYQWIKKNYERFNETRKNGYFKTDKFKEWSKKNQLEMKEYNRWWRRNNKDKLKKYAEERKYHKEHVISQDELDVLYEYANHSCMYCGLKEEESIKIFGQKLHRDHAYNKGSNGIDNCVLACKSCNSSKHSRDWDEWYLEDNPIYDDVLFNLIVEWLEKF